jgi:hypothetical protein
MTSGLFSTAPPCDEVTLSGIGGYLKAKNGLYQFVERLTPTVGNSTADFATALDGNADGDYIIIGKCLNHSDATILLRMNGAAISGNTQNIGANNTTISGSRSANILLGYNDGTPTFALYFETLVIAKSGYRRAVITRFLRELSATTSVAGFSTSQIDDTATNITSLGISSTTHFEADSYFDLFRIKRT